MELINIISVAVERSSKAVIVKHSQLLTDLLIQVFDIRRIQANASSDKAFDEEDVEQVEQALNEAAIKMIYKLNDTHFRPLFSRIMDWATCSLSKRDTRGRLSRLTTWYTFLHHFFDTLKVKSLYFANSLLSLTSSSQSLPVMPAISSTTPLKHFIKSTHPTMKL